MGNPALNTDEQRRLLFAVNVYLNRGDRLEDILKTLNHPSVGKQSTVLRLRAIWKILLEGTAVRRLSNLLPILLSTDLQKYLRTLKTLKYPAQILWVVQTEHASRLRGMAQQIRDLSLKEVETLWLLANYVDGPVPEFPHAWGYVLFYAIYRPLDCQRATIPEVLTMGLQQFRFWINREVIHSSHTRESDHDYATELYQFFIDYVRWLERDNPFDQPAPHSPEL